MKSLVLMVLLATASLSDACRCSSVVVPNYKVHVEVKHSVANCMSSWNAAAKYAEAITPTIESLGSKAGADVSSLAGNDVFLGNCRQFVASWNEATKSSRVIDTTFQSAIQTEKQPALKVALKEFYGAWEAAASRVFKLQNMLSSSPNLDSLSNLALEFADSFDTSSARLTSLQSIFHQLSGAPPLPGTEVSGVIPKFVIEMENVDDEFQDFWDTTALDIESAPSFDFVEGVDKVLSEPFQYVPDITSKFDKHIQSVAATVMGAWNNAYSKVSQIQNLLFIPGGEISVPQDTDVVNKIGVLTDDFSGSCQEAEKFFYILEKEVALHPETTKLSNQVSNFMETWKASMERLLVIRDRVNAMINAGIADAEKVKYRTSLQKAATLFHESWNKAIFHCRQFRPIFYNLADTIAAPELPDIQGPELPIFMPDLDKSTHDFLEAWSVAESYFPEMEEMEFPELPEMEAPAFDSLMPAVEFMVNWNKAVGAANDIKTTLITYGDTGHISVAVPQQAQIDKLQTTLGSFSNCWEDARTNLDTMLFSLPDIYKTTADDLVAKWESAVQASSVIKDRLSTYSSGHSEPEKQKAWDDILQVTQTFMDAWTEATEKTRDLQAKIYEIAGSAPALEFPSMPIFSPLVESSKTDFIDLWNKVSVESPTIESLLDEDLAPRLPVAVAPVKALATIPVGDSMQQTITEFMAAWNTASVQVTHISSMFMKSMDANGFPVPSDESERDLLLTAIQQFTSSFNFAISKAILLVDVLSTLPEEGEGVTDLQRNIGEFLHVWREAGKQLFLVGDFITTNPLMCQVCLAETAIPQFLAAIQEASALIQKIETSLYVLGGYNAVDTCAACLNPEPVPDTAEVETAKSGYTTMFTEAMSSSLTDVYDAILPVPSFFFKYSSCPSIPSVPIKKYTFRIFAPFRSLPLFASDD